MSSPGASDDPFQDSEGREGWEAAAEHQFSDLEDSDSGSDLDEEEDEEEEEESQDEPSGPLEADSPAGQGPGPRDVHLDSQASRASPVSEGPAANSGSASSQGGQCVPHLASTSADPMDKDTGSAPSTQAGSPRRPWSPSKESASRPPLTHQHAPSQSDASSQPHTPARGPPTSTPSLPDAPPGPHPSGSPRFELSPLSAQPPEREQPPQTHLTPELKGNTDPASPRHSPTRSWLLGQAESPPWSALPGQWTSAGSGSSSATKRGPGSGLAPRALFRPSPLPHQLLGRSPETCASAWVSPCCHPGAFPQPGGMQG